MKITNKQMGYAALVLCGAGSILYSTIRANRVENTLKKQKIEIQQKAPEKYSLLLQREKAGKVINWSDALENVHDSLKTDSMVKEAYFKGYQRALDSINAKKFLDSVSNAAKVIK